MAGASSDAMAAGMLGQDADVDPHSPAAMGSRREKFLPITRHALMDRLTAGNLWPNGDAVPARRSGGAPRPHRGAPRVRHRQT